MPGKPAPFAAIAASILLLFLTVLALGGGVHSQGFAFLLPMAFLGLLPLLPAKRIEASPARHPASRALLSSSSPRSPPQA